MNKQRKILTVVALAVFGAIILLHYGRVELYHLGRPDFGLHLNHHEVIKDVRMPLFVLTVFYAGLFFILATPGSSKS
jgi:hypothetical protein